MRASAVVKRQSMVQLAALRAAAQAAAAVARAAWSAKRPRRHWRREDAQLDLGHGEPGAVLGGVVELQLVGEALGLGGRDGRVEGGGGVGVAVIQHQHDALGVGVVDVDQRLDAVREVQALVRRSLTTTCRQPRKGSQARKRLATPARTYS